MTDLLEQAFKKASALPPDAQDEIARAWLEQLAADERWEAVLASPKGKATLSRLAVEARADVAAGRAIDADPSTFPE